MAFTYGPDLSIPLNYVRFRMNDNDSETPIYQDEEIQFFINKLGDNPTDRQLDGIALKLLKQYLHKLTTGPARERAGAYEVYNMSAETLRILIADLETDIKSASTPQPFFGGVYRDQVCRNRRNPALTDNVWEQDQFEEGECVDDRDFYNRKF